MKKTVSPATPLRSDEGDGKSGVLTPQDRDERLLAAGEKYKRVFLEFCRSARPTDQQRRKLVDAVGAFTRAVDEWNAAGGRAADLPKPARKRSAPEGSSQKGIQ